MGQQEQRAWVPVEPHQASRGTAAVHLFAWCERVRAISKLFGMFTCRRRVALVASPVEDMTRRGCVNVAPGARRSRHETAARDVCCWASEGSRRVRADPAISGFAKRRKPGAPGFEIETRDSRLRVRSALGILMPQPRLARPSPTYP